MNELIKDLMIPNKRISHEEAFIVKSLVAVA